MLRSALALCGAGLLLAGCQAQAGAQPPPPSAGIPELINRCVDGRDIGGQVANCTEAVEARVGSDDLQDLARYSLALAGHGSFAPRGIPAPILQCLYAFDVEGRLASCTRAIDAEAGSTETPFSMIEWTRASTRSTNVPLPGWRQVNRMVVVEPNVLSPVVRSRSTV